MQVYLIENTDSLFNKQCITLCSISSSKFPFFCIFDVLKYEYCGANKPNSKG